MPASAQVSRLIWAAKYRRRDAGGRQEASPAASFRRVATALAAVERDPASWAARFHALMGSLAFLPGGRILAGAGSDGACLFNCFVLPIADAGFETALAATAATLRAGGGVGHDLSALHPAGDGWPGVVARLAALDRCCGAQVSAGSRRGALMATLRCDHPEIAAFAAAKRAPGALPHCNISVLVSDAFIAAIRARAPWPLVDADGQVRATVPAHQLWDDIARCAYDSAEPGALFIDTINATNNLGWRERIGATNPCGEIPLPAFGACCLGSFSLPRFVRDPFTPAARLDLAALAAAVPVALRMLDNAIDVSAFPLPAQAAEARATRRVGLGIMGLADSLAMLGLAYDSPAARTTAATAMQVLRDAAYRASLALALEKGPFPAIDRRAHAAAPFIATLPADVVAGIARHGIRNSHLLAIAPTGSISLLADAVSSGIEPLFAARYRRSLPSAEGGRRDVHVTSHAVRLWRRGPPRRCGLPPAFMAAPQVSAAAQLAMQASLQPHVDNAISKTVMLPADMDFASFRDLLLRAHDLGLKGCAAWRPGSVRGTVLEAERDRCGDSCTIGGTP